MAQLMPLPLTVSCFSKIQIGFTFLVPAHLGSPGKGPLNRCVPMLMSIKRYTQSLTQIETQRKLKLPSKVPIHAEKYAICALC